MGTWTPGGVLSAQAAEAEAAETCLHKAEENWPLTLSWVAPSCATAAGPANPPAIPFVSPVPFPDATLVAEFR